MTTELCDICGINMNSPLSITDKPATFKISRKLPYKDEVELVLCGRCHSAILETIAKKSRKEWKQEAKTKLRELFP